MPTAERQDHKTSARDSQRTRAKILRAATVLFAAKGPDATRVDEIAARAGVNKRMLYHYFGSKKSLYLSVLGDTSDRLHRLLGHSIAEAKVEVLVAIGDYAKITATAAKEKAKYDLEIKCFEDSISACNNLEKIVKDTDIILVKGSRRTHLETVIERLKELFS